MKTNSTVSSSLIVSAASLCFTSVACNNQGIKQPGSPKPNVILVFADQWRAQASGYAGDPNAITPALDRLASQSVVFTTAVSNAPVSSPYRASLITGRYATSHGVFMNDVTLNPGIDGMGKLYSENGYQTGWIGKWHLDGHGRSSYIPPDRRHGFEYWKVLECTHNYNNSFYYHGNDSLKKKWEGYDAYYQTLDAIKYINEKSRGPDPFLLVLSWGPPHNPYQTAPGESKAVYKDREILLRDNVPEEDRARAIEDLRGYYSHINALDKCIDTLIKSIDLAGIAGNTIFIFTSDHGDMLFSHGMERKQKPFDESILVPLLIHKPGLKARAGKIVSSPVSTPDLLPTMLTLCGIEVPGWIEGRDFSGLITGKASESTGHALIMSVTPFGEWNRNKGGIEYRGLRTERYTYVRNLDGPWLLFDNLNDMFQMNNLINNPGYSEIQEELDSKLAAELKRLKDDFLPGSEYITKWGYKVDETGTVPYQQ